MKVEDNLVIRSKVKKISKAARIEILGIDTPWSIDS